MLAAYVEDNQNKCFTLLGVKSKAANNEVSVLVGPVTTDPSACLDECSWLDSNPSDSTILSFAEKMETNGSIAYSAGSETMGSVAYSGGCETMGSVASSAGGFSSASSSCGGGCSYSC